VAARAVACPWSPEDHDFREAPSPVVGFCWLLQCLTPASQRYEGLLHFHVAGAPQSVGTYSVTASWLPPVVRVVEGEGCTTYHAERILEARRQQSLGWTSAARRKGGSWGEEGMAEGEAERDGADSGAVLVMSSLHV